MVLFSELFFKYNSYYHNCKRRGIHLRGRRFTLASWYNFFFFLFFGGKAINDDIKMVPFNTVCLATTRIRVQSCEYTNTEPKKKVNPEKSWPLSTTKLKQLSRLIYKYFWKRWLFLVMLGWNSTFPHCLFFRQYCEVTNSYQGKELYRCKHRRYDAAQPYHGRYDAAQPYRCTSLTPAVSFLLSYLTDYMCCVCQNKTKRIIRPSAQKTGLSWLSVSKDQKLWQKSVNCSQQWPRLVMSLASAEWHTAACVMSLRSENMYVYLGLDTDSKSWMLPPECK